MILLEPALLAKLDGTLAGLQDALQAAIELEHSTIPPYLYAYYSLKQGQNQEIADLLLSVVIEEMLHMGLACNVLNAIGGSPVIDTPALIPTYPGPLPGSVHGTLTVHLAPFSIDLVATTFMGIEEPEVPLVFPTKRMLEALPPSPTIGVFYNRIMDQIRELSAKGNIFTGDPARQLKAWRPPLTNIAVTDEASALAMLGVIVEQGEGTSESPQADPDELAHYYRYEEIVKGFQLVKTPQAPFYAYTGTPIPFDPAGVYPLITDPAKTPYAAGTRAATVNNLFNYTYTSLLKALHTTFNGAPQLGPSIAIMQSLHSQAIDVMETPIPGTPFNAGPSFEYLPVLPA